MSAKGPLECRRGRTIPPTAGSAAPHAGVAWRLTTTAAVLPRAKVEQLARARALPDPGDLVLLRVRPGDAATCTVRLQTIAHDEPLAAHELAFAVAPAKLDDQGAFAVTLAFVSGGVDGLALPGVTLVDATGATRVDVSGAGGGPLPLDLEGAPRPAPGPSPEPGVVRALLQGLHFETDKTLLLPSAMVGIGRLRRLLAARPGLSLLVVGHADAAGAADHNLTLSEARARSTLQYLQDDVDGWLAAYDAPGASKAWGRREDQLMLSALPGDDAAPFWTGPPTGQDDEQTARATRAFQVWSNARRGTALDEDGELGPKTRREVVAAYMELDGQTLPAGTPTALHGCGEHHPEVPTPDGVADPANRRVEVFLFQGPIDPAPQATCPAPGCAEYARWRERTTQTIDLSQEAGELAIAVTDERDRPLGAADVSIAGPEQRVAQADGAGLARFADLLAGVYEVTAAREGFTTRRVQVEVLAGRGTRPVATASTRSSLVEGEPAPAAPDGPTRVQLAAAPCRSSRRRIKDLLEKTPARALSLWQAAHVVAHLHDEGKIRLHAPPSGACEGLSVPGPSKEHAGRFAVSMDADVTGESGKKVSLRYIGALKDPRSGAAVGWKFAALPLLHVDVRLVVFLYHLVTWLTRGTFGGKHVLSILHIGFNGHLGQRNDRTNEQTGVTWKVLNDAHWSGRAMDFGGVLLGDEGGAPIDQWRFSDRAAEEPVVVLNHWGNAPGLKAPGYRLEADRAGSGIARARAEVFYEAMKMCVRHTSLSGSRANPGPRYDPTYLADGGLAAAVDEFFTHRGALIHPDYPVDARASDDDRKEQERTRARHANHIHLQIGPTRYEFVTRHDADEDLKGAQDPRAPITREQEHERHAGGVGVVQDVGKPPPDDVPAPAPTTGATLPV